MHRRRVGSDGMRMEICTAALGNPTARRIGVLGDGGIPRTSSSHQTTIARPRRTLGRIACKRASVSHTLDFDDC